MPDYTPHKIDLSLYPSCDETTEFAADQELEISKRYRDIEGKLSLIEIFRVEDDKTYLFRRKILAAAEEGKPNLEMFDSDGVLKQFAFGTYDENGNMHGKWICHRAEGYKFFEGEYKNDKANGKYTYYESRGNIYAEGTFENDKCEGLYTDYYENGSVFDKGSYKDDMREGIWTRYYSSGAPLKRGEFRKGNAEGLF